MTSSDSSKDDRPIVYRIRKKQQPGPNCLWSIKRPDLGFVGEGYLFQVIANNCANWRRSNGWPVGLAFEDELEQALCAQYLESCPDICMTDDPRAPLHPNALTYRKVLMGTKILMSWAASGFNTVSSQEAQRRAVICSGCRYNVPWEKGCGGHICGEMLAILQKVATQPTSLDDKLNACQICGCSLQVAVHLPREMQWDPMPENMKEQFNYHAPKECWKKPLESA